MEYRWIDVQQLPSLRKGDRLVLFGAGQGSVEFLNLLHERGIGADILGIADNDSSMWGKDLQGVPIVDPASLPNLDLTWIIITTVSGRDAVALQLDSMGFVEARNYCRIGIYPTVCVGRLHTLLDRGRKYGFMKPESRVLHVGPGGFLGLEVFLHALGYSPCSMDAYSFGVCFPDITERLGEYQSVGRDFFRVLPSLGYEDEPVRSRFEQLFSQTGDRTFLDEDAIVYKHPARFSSMPFADESMDVVTSFEVLEHTVHPRRAVAEIRRTLKPGGIGYHYITTCDHRSFGLVDGYHPASYLDHSEEQWEEINRDKFYQNRILPSQWRELFIEAGFDLVDYVPRSIHVLTEEQKKALHPDFAHVADRGRVDVNCEIVVRKK